MGCTPGQFLGTAVVGGENVSSFTSSSPTFPTSDACRKLPQRLHWYILTSFAVGKNVFWFSAFKNHTDKQSVVPNVIYSTSIVIPVVA